MGSRAHDFEFPSFMTLDTSVTVISATATATILHYIILFVLKGEGFQRKPQIRREVLHVLGFHHSSSHW